MFTDGQKVKGKVDSEYKHYTFVVVDTFDDGTFNGEVVDHAFDDEVIGEFYEDLPYGDFSVISTPKGTHGSTIMPTISKSISDPSVANAMDLMALGII